MSRDYTRFDGYVNRLTQDVYAQPPDEGHLLWGLQAIHTLFSIPQGCTNVLDIGCGQGQFRTAMETLGLAWTGVVLGEDYAIAAAAGLNVKQADMTFLPFDDGAFDLIFARHVLEHSPFPVITLMEWRRVCRGWMALVLPAPDYWKVKGRNHYSVLPKDNWLWLLERSGWHPLHEHTMTTDDDLFLRAWKSDLPPEPDVDVEYRFLCERAEEMTA